MSKKFKLPDLGEGVHEGQIVKVFVSPGDHVQEDTPLFEVETDKAAVEIPSPHTGTVSHVHITPHQIVAVGDVMIEFFETKGAGDGTAAPPPPAKEPAAAPTPASAAPTAAAGAGLAPRRFKPASPAVRKLARTLGVDLAQVQGTGSGGRVTRADVELAVGGAGARPAVPSAATFTPPPSRPSPLPPPSSPVAAVPIVELEGEDDTDQYGAIRRVPLTQARKTIARVMAQSWSTIPHVTDCHDADVTELDRLRRGYHSPGNEAHHRLTLLPFVVRAVVRALERFPQFNASFDEENQRIIYRRYINVALGVHTERGLIAPVIRETDRLGVIALAQALHTIAEKARTASFAVDDTRGGTYTISNPGALGNTVYSTPLITPPQVAVLGLGRARWQPSVVDGKIVPRLTLPLSHSFDHRINDGGEEIAFMKHVVEDLENPARLVL